MNKQVEPDEWRAVWYREGFESVPESLYFYESPPGGPNGVWGYFSFSPIPGTPHRHWTPETDDAGELWGWTFVSEDWTVEISKYVFWSRDYLRVVINMSKLSQAQRKAIYTLCAVVIKFRTLRMSKIVFGSVLKNIVMVSLVNSSFHVGPSRLVFSLDASHRFPHFFVPIRSQT